MPARSKQELINYFGSGKRPLSSHYSDLIDSLFAISDTTSGDLIIEPLNKVLFVDKIVTNPLITPTKGFINKPYNDLQDALSDANAGDLIMIFPGNYEVSNLFKSGIKFFAFPGVNITNGVDSTSAIFSGVSGECEFWGKAKFTENDSTIAKLSGAGTKLKLQCDTILVNKEVPAFDVSVEAKLWIDNTTIISTVDGATFTTTIFLNPDGVMRFSKTSIMSTQGVPTSLSSGSGLYEAIGTITTNMPQGSFSLRSGQLVVDRLLTTW